MGLDFVFSVSGHHTVTPAVAKINQQTDSQPDNQPDPVLIRQREHQEQTRQNTENRNNRNQRASEWTMRIRISSAHDQNRATNNYKREKSPDAGHLRENAERDETGHGGHK